MPANHLFKNRLRAYNARQKKLKSQPIPPGFALCPAGVLASLPANQMARVQGLYQQAYEAARQNVVPFYLRPVLGSGN